MTFRKLYQTGKKILEQAGNESPAFDCISIFKFYFNKDRYDLIELGNEEVNLPDENKFLSLIDERKLGKPLQYIIGEWTFMENKIKVGKGVLIPRDDTEVLVNECVRRIEKIKNPNIIDLCSGSGAVSIGVYSLRNDCNITCAEISQKAFDFLLENLEINNMKNAIPKKIDILKDFNMFNDLQFDMIVSNPPYIKTEDMLSLQREVKHEPKLALDGGKDGLLFYRSIAKNWVSKLKIGGSIATEIGIEQSKQVCEIFEQSGLSDIKVIKDISNIDRVVSAKKVKSID